MGTAAWCSTAPTARGWLPLPLGLVLHPTAPPAHWVPTDCWAGAHCHHQASPATVPSPGRAGIAAATAGLDARCLEDFLGGGHYPDAAPELARAPPALPSVGLGLPRAITPHTLGTSLAGGRQEAEPPRAGVPGAWLRLRASSRILPQGCRGAEPQHPGGTGSTQPCTCTHPGTPRGCSIPGGHTLHTPHHSQSWGHQAGGAKEEGLSRGAAASLGPKGRQPAAPTAPPPLSGLVTSLSLSPSAHRGGGELEAWAGGGRGRASADAAGTRGAGDEPPPRA